MSSTRRKTTTMRCKKCGRVLPFSAKPGLKPPTLEYCETCDAKLFEQEITDFINRYLERKADDLAESYFFTRISRSFPLEMQGVSMLLTLEHETRPVKVKEFLTSWKDSFIADRMAKQEHALWKQNAKRRWTIFFDTVAGHDPALMERRVRWIFGDLLS